MPILKEAIFTIECKALQYVSLVENGITEIENNALNNLTDLKWISFLKNDIKLIEINIFKNNGKLKFIDFSLIK
jgi:hypothetical protein